jgi:hypothetical protein
MFGLVSIGFPSWNRVLIASLFTLYYLARIPLPLYSGLVANGFQSVIDNCNIGYILLVLTPFPVIDRISSFEPKTINFYGLIGFSLFGLIISSLLVSMLLSFTTHESLIILFYGILRLEPFVVKYLFILLFTFLVPKASLLCGNPEATSLRV